MAMARAVSSHVPPCGSGLLRQTRRVRVFRRRDLRRAGIRLLARRRRSVSLRCARLTVSLLDVGLPVALLLPIARRVGRLTVAGNGWLRPSEGCPDPTQPCDVRDCDDCPDYVDVPGSKHRDADHYEGDLEAESEHPGGRRRQGAQDKPNPEGTT